jgi:hypothetical protein
MRRDPNVGTMIQIYDSFIFYNELDLLEIRLHELAPVVDRFVLVEGSQTFVGNSKPSYFLLNRDRYAAYLPKITHVIVSDWPDTDDAWQREFHQRDALMRGCSDLRDDDIVLFSDVDEIPSREAVAKLRGHEASSFAFQQTFSYFRFDYLRQHQDPWLSSCTIGERRGTMRHESVSDRRKSRLRRIKDWRAGRAPTGFTFIDPPGWHASYLGDDGFVRNKIRNFSHQEYNKADFLEEIDIEKIIRSERDLFGRHTAEWSVADQPIAVPHLIREQPDRFAKYFVRRMNLPA